MPIKTSAPRPKILRIVGGHLRLFLCVAIGLVAFAAMTGHGTLASRFLIAWDIFAFLYLCIAFSTFADFDVRRVRRRAAVEDEGAFFLLMMTVTGAAASLGAILAVLGSAKGNSNPHAFYFAFALVTIMLSWCLIHTAFAFHYAHEFYGSGRDHRFGGLRFPNDNQPDYWDFVYFSFVVGMTFQVSDVQVTSKRIRHVVVLHGIVSFVFTVSILSLAVNIASNFI